VKFVLDAMLPPLAVGHLEAGGHDAVTPAGLGAQNLPDDALLQIATAEGRVIVTENAADFAHVTTCHVLFVRKSWWPRHTLALRLAAALDQWAAAHPDPGPWPHWMEDEVR
jgi:uncharacterized protein with PIN domain